MNRRGMLGSIIGGFVVILVGLTFLPHINDAVNEVSGNVSGVSESIVGLTTTFFAIAIFGAGVLMAFNGIKQSGMIGTGGYQFEDLKSVSNNIYQHRAQLKLSFKDKFKNIFNKKISIRFRRKHAKETT